MTLLLNVESLFSSPQSHTSKVTPLVSRLTANYLSCLLLLVVVIILEPLALEWKFPGLTFINVLKYLPLCAELFGSKNYEFSTSRIFSRALRFMSGVRSPSPAFSDSLGLSPNYLSLLNRVNMNRILQSYSPNVLLRRSHDRRIKLSSISNTLPEPLSFDPSFFFNYLSRMLLM